MNNSKPGPGVPWLALLLAAAAVISFFASSTVDIAHMRLASALINMSLPLVMLGGTVGFFWGLVRFLINTDQVVRNNGVHILLWSLLAIVVAVVSWGTLHLLQNTFGIQNGSAINVAIPSVAPSQPSSYPSRDYGNSYPESDMMAPQAMMGSSASLKMGPDYYPYQGGTANINDTREFNKIYYNATLKTRDVPGVTKLVETTVRGNGGRVDNTTSSDKYGSVSFAVPQDKFDDFRNQIESFVDSRFLSISVNSQNMLPQKQAIEKRQDYSNMNLGELNASRKSENATFAQKKTSMQEQIDANDRELAMLEKSLETTTDNTTRGNIGSRQMQLYGEQGTLKNQLTALERSHLNNINSIDAQIRYVNGDLKALDQETQNLLDNVATVTGTISLRWVSLWEVAQAYLPGYDIPAIFAFLAVIAAWWQRRKPVIA